MSNGNWVKVDWWDDGPRTARFTTPKAKQEPRMNLLTEYPHLPQISNEYE